MKFRNLKQKLLFFSICLIVVTVAPVIALTAYLISKDSIETYQSTIREDISSLDETISLFYDDLDRNIDMYATYHLIQDADASITSYMDKSDTRYDTTKGSEIEQKLGRDFKHYMDTHPGTLYVYMATEDGGYIQLPETKSVDNFDPRGRPWYQLGKNAGLKIIRTDPYLDLNSNSMLVSNLRSFKNAAGEVYGVIGIDVSTEKLTDILNQAKLGETGYFMMLHKSGLILADAKYEDHILKNINEIGIEGMEQVVQEEETTFVTKVNGSSYRVNSMRSGKTDWIIVGLIEEHELTSAYTSLLFPILIVTLIVVGVISLVVAIVSSRMTRPIHLIAESLKAIAQGEADLSQRLDVTSNDEIGDLARWFNQFLEKLQSIIVQIKKNAEATKNSADSLKQLSGDLNTNTGHLSEKSQTVSSATEEMSTMISTVASAVEQYSANINVVASSAEEMTSSVDEIAMSSSNARNITADSVLKVNDTNHKMEELGIAAKEISKVTEVINAISDQTNLLALNATIEAASAGEAGKGFAVVANEIKELARQTAKATTEIQKQIDHIQSSTKNSILGINEINEIIAEVDNIVTTIASAVEEQSATSREISINITQASEGIGEVSRSTSEGSEATNEISRDIIAVDALVSELASNSQTLNEKAKELDGSAEDLTLLVSQFKV